MNSSRRSPGCHGVEGEARGHGDVQRFDRWPHRQRDREIGTGDDLARQPRTLAALGEAAAGDPVNAVKIRNRAMEIRKAERVPFAEAFSRAEKEITST